MHKCRLLKIDKTYKWNQFSALGQRLIGVVASIHMHSDPICPWWQLDENFFLFALIGDKMCGTEYAYKSADCTYSPVTMWSENNNNGTTELMFYSILLFYNNIPSSGSQRAPFKDSLLAQTLQVHPPSIQIHLRHCNLDIRRSVGVNRIYFIFLCWTCSDCAFHR